VGALPIDATQLARGEDHGCAAVVLQGRTEILCYGRPGALANGSEWVADTVPATQWEATPVVWDKANFAPALD
jgi:hypothetical protein